MRKWNAVITSMIMALFLVHTVVGIFQLAGWMRGGIALLRFMAWALLVLVVLHAIIGVILTIRTLRSARRAGVAYGKENRRFWTRRISGFAMLLFLLCHMILFTQRRGEAVRLAYFGKMALATQILLVASLAVHIITNLRPALIALGIRRLKDYAIDILFVLSVLLFLMGVAFCVYYLRWQSI